HALGPARQGACRALVDPARDARPPAQLAVPGRRGRHSRPPGPHSRGGGSEDPGGETLRYPARSSGRDETRPAARSGIPLGAGPRLLRPDPGGRGGDPRTPRQPVVPPPPAGGGVAMALARTRSVALLGVEGYGIDVEAHIGTGKPGLTLVGLPD